MTVAAENAKDAAGIAKGVLFEEATQLPPGMRIVKREAEANEEKIDPESGFISN